jgi:glycosyltransferase involved in cell wall biosynthesis
MTTRVVHVITGLDTGGAERMLEKVVMNAARHCTDIVVSLSDFGPIGRRLIDAGIDVRALGFGPRSVSLPGLYRLLQLLRQIKPHAVQGWLYHGNLMASVAVFLARLHEAKVHWGIRGTLYGLEREKSGTRAVIRLLARMSARPDSIHYNSNKSREQHEALGFNHERSVVIPNGFDVDAHKRDQHESAAARERLNIAKTAFVIGMVTRDHPMKAHHKFLEAAARFVAAGGDAEFLLAGRGITADNDYLTGTIARLGLESRTHLLGELADPSAAYRAMDVLALTSEWGEAFPNVLGEAMSFEIPCVTTDIGDSANIVGESGIVVPIGDAEGIARAFGDLQSMGEAGRHRLGALARTRVVENYSMREICQRFNRLHGVQ